MSSKRKTGQLGFWKSLPLGSSATFFTGVFCFFATFTFIFDAAQPTPQSLASLSESVLLSGGTAVVFAYLGTRQKYKIMVLLAVVEFGIVPLVLRHIQQSQPQAPAPALNSAAVHHELVLDSAGTGVFIILGYLLMFYFVRKEGQRYFRVHSEMKLAADIHRSLVPEISRRVGNFEFYGASVPSGAVGGDLLDVIEHGGEWFSYVADVSGHGVPAGVLMAMVKSAARMRLSGEWRAGTFLDDLNAVLQPLQQPETFVTFAYLRGGNDSRLEFSLAGHLPILHFRAPSGEAVEHSVSNLPLGIFAEQQFESATLTAGPADLLVILTDGLPETFDGKQRELGLEGVKRMISAIYTKPLKEIFEHVRSSALDFGKQLDDQTMLLIRRLNR